MVNKEVEILLCHSGKSVERVEHKLLSQISRLYNLMLFSRKNSKITFFYRVFLCTLSKKDCGIRPIAVSCTFRRLVSKPDCRRTSEKLANYLKSIQPKIGVKSGRKTTRTYLNKNAGFEISSNTASQH